MQCSGILAPSTHLKFFFSSLKSVGKRSSHPDSRCFSLAAIRSRRYSTGLVFVNPWPDRGSLSATVDRRPTPSCVICTAFPWPFTAFPLPSELVRWSGFTHSPASPPPGAAAWIWRGVARSVQRAGRPGPARPCARHRPHAADGAPSGSQQKRRHGCGEDVPMPTICCGTATTVPIQHVHVLLVGHVSRPALPVMGLSARRSRRRRCLARRTSVAVTGAPPSLASARSACG